MHSVSRCLPAVNMACMEPRERCVCMCVCVGGGGGRGVLISSGMEFGYCIATGGS